MGANSFGQRFRITTFGESHGRALGVVIDGCPANLKFDEELLTKNLQRRRPGQGGVQQGIVSPRNEQDQFEILSGVFDGKTLGTPIAIIIYNLDQRSKDYQNIQRQPRPGHADDVWKKKFEHVDYRGGGRASGRETVTRVIAGSVAQMILQKSAPSLKVLAFTTQVGSVALTSSEISDYLINYSESRHPDYFYARLPHKEKSEEVLSLLKEAKTNGQSYGGLAHIIVTNPPLGLGQPVFHKLKSDMAQSLMSIGAVVGVELGHGFSVADREGSEFHDPEQSDNSRYGGIRGGISTGESILFRVAFKPTATVLHEAKKGRHDPCIIPRALPVLEAMMNLTLVDHLLWAKTDKLD